MNTRLCVLFVLAGLTAVLGCKSDPRLLALERENRNLEDTIYELQDQLDRAEGELTMFRRSETAAPSRERVKTSRPPAATIERSDPEQDLLPGPSLTTPATPAMEKSPPPKPESAPVGKRRKRSSGDDVPSLDVQIGTESATPPGEVPKALQRGSRPSSEPDSSHLVPRDRNSLPPAPPANPSTKPSGERSERSRLGEPNRMRAPGQARDIRSMRRRDDSDVMQAGVQTVEPTADSVYVDHLELHPRFTGGFESDGRPGHDGVAMLIVLRDVNHRAVPAAAPVSVVLIDRELPEATCRVARWDFTAGEVLQRYRRSSQGEGIYLKLPWSASPPTRSRLDLFVRYVTRDGRKLEAHQELRILPPVAAADSLVAAPPGSREQGSVRHASQSTPVSRGNADKGWTNVEAEDGAARTPARLTPVASKPVLEPVPGDSTREAGSGAATNKESVSKESGQGPILGDPSNRTAASPMPRDASGPSAAPTTDGKPAEAKTVAPASGTDSEFRAGGRSEPSTSRQRPEWMPNRR